MNVLAFGVTLVIVAVFLVSISPAITDSLNTVDAEHPNIDNTAFSLARLYPFIIFVGAILVLSFLFWRGGTD